jgi:hypothetical protein
MPLFTFETLPGETIQVGSHKITPFSQVVRFTTPQKSGGLIWNRPVSVLVQGVDGSETVLPVEDVTRKAQLTLLGLGLLGGILLWIITRR